MTDKLDDAFVLLEYNSDKNVEIYSRAIDEVGLMQSERILFNEFLSKDDNILDLGCGAGRVSVSLYLSGYKNIIGLDMAEKQIECARQYIESKEYQIDYRVGNAVALPFVDESFNAVIFSFNGLMTIPDIHRRQKAIGEVNRVLIKHGIFIFTTHDRDISKQSELWLEERVRWDNSEQDTRMYDFGDRVFIHGDEETFLHVPSRSEVMGMLELSGFDVVYTEMRSDICDEPPEVIRFSDECRFWVAKKR